VHASLPNARIEQGDDGIAGAVETGDVTAAPTLDRTEISIEMALYLPVIRTRKLPFPRRFAGLLRCHAPLLTP